MKFRIRFLSLVLFLLPQFLICQISAPTYSDFIIILKSGERIEGRNGVVKSSQLTGQTLTNSPLSYPLKDIQTLYISTGTKAGSMALVCGAVGLATSLLAILEANTSDVGVDGKKATALTLGLTGAGILIGAVVGSSMHTWQTIENPDSTLKLSESAIPQQFNDNSPNKKGD